MMVEIFAVVGWLLCGFIAWVLIEREWIQNNDDTTMEGFDLFLLVVCMVCGLGIFVGRLGYMAYISKWFEESLSKLLKWIERMIRRTIK